jgi:hypothetical protein
MERCRHNFYIHIIKIFLPNLLAKDDFSAAITDKGVRKRPRIHGIDCDFRAFANISIGLNDGTMYRGVWEQL